MEKNNKNRDNGILGNSLIDNICRAYRRPFGSHHGGSGREVFRKFDPDEYKRICDFGSKITSDALTIYESSSIIPQSEPELSVYGRVVTVEEIKKLLDIEDVPVAITKTVNNIRSTDYPVRSVVTPNIQEIKPLLISPNIPKEVLEKLNENLKAFHDNNIETSYKSVKKIELTISHKKVKSMNGPYVYVFMINGEPICTVRKIEDINKISSFVLGKSNGDDITDGAIKKLLKNIIGGHQK